jgi:hypothetical protein
MQILFRHFGFENASLVRVDSSPIEPVFGIHGLDSGLEFREPNLFERGLSYKESFFKGGLHFLEYK